MEHNGIEIKATLIKGVCVVVKNQDTCMGNYYSEDQWSLIGVGATLEEAIHLAVKEHLEDFGFYHLRDLHVAAAYTEETDFIVYDGQRFHGPRSVKSKELDHRSVDKIIESDPEYIAAKNEAEKLEQIRLHKQKNEQEELDRLKYEELHARFGHLGDQ